MPKESQPLCLRLYLNLLGQFRRVFEHESILVVFNELMEAVRGKLRLFTGSDNHSDPQNEVQLSREAGCSEGTHHWKRTAQTGRQQPNMSTTFMGRSKPLEDVCRQTPRSAEPEKAGWSTFYRV